MGYPAVSASIPFEHALFRESRFWIAQLAGCQAYLRIIARLESSRSVPG